MDYQVGDKIPLDILSQRMDRYNPKINPIKIKLIQIDGELYLGVWDAVLDKIISRILSDNPTLKLLPKDRVFEIIRAKVYKNLARKKKTLYTLLKEGKRQFIGIFQGQKIPIEYCEDGDILSPKAVKGRINILGQETDTTIQFVFRVKDGQISNLLNRLLKNK